MFAGMLILSKSDIKKSDIRTKESGIKKSDISDYSFQQKRLIRFRSSPLNYTSAILN
jgi:hypothetical protein